MDLKKIEADIEALQSQLEDAKAQELPARPKQGGDVELAPEEVEPVRKAHAFIGRAKADLAQLVLAYERKKAQLIKLIDENEEVFNSRIEQLQERYGFPEDANIELGSEGDPAKVTW